MTGVRNHTCVLYRVSRVNVNTTDATAGATALLLPAQNTHTLHDPKRDTEHARAGGVEDGLGVAWGVGGLDTAVTHIHIHALTGVGKKNRVIRRPLNFVTTASPVVGYIDRGPSVASRKPSVTIVQGWRHDSVTGCFMHNGPVHGPVMTCSRSGDLPGRYVLKKAPENCGGGGGSCTGSDQFQ